MRTHPCPNKCGSDAYLVAESYGGSGLRMVCGRQDTWAAVTGKHRIMYLLLLCAPLAETTQRARASRASIRQASSEVAFDDRKAGESEFGAAGMRLGPCLS